MNADSTAAPLPIPFDPAARDLGVVVGFDGSDNATRALTYAARVATGLGTTLTAVTAYRIPIPMYATYAAIPTQPDDEAGRQRAQSLLDRAAELLAEHPGEVTYLTTEGDSVGALADISSRARLMIVGARGRGGFLGRILGSVATALPGHAHCPTIVVPDTDRQDEAGHASAGRPVVVGVDESRHGRIAALQAAQEADRRGAPLHLLLALPPLDGGLPWYPELSPEVAGITERRRAELQHVLEAEISWLQERVPAVEMSGEVRIGEPAAVLEEATGTAQLTVVGTRGRGAIASALLGSTSRALLHQADGPVMIVPALQDERAQE